MMARYQLCVVVAAVVGLCCVVVSADGSPSRTPATSKKSDLPPISKKAADPPPAAETTATRSTALGTEVSLPDAASAAIARFYGNAVSLLEHPLVAPFKPHLRNIKAGAFSVVYGPLVFLYEASYLPNTFWTEVPSSSACWCAKKIFRAAKLRALDRFEFSVGSLVVEVILFQAACGLLRRSRLLGRLFGGRSQKHCSWVSLLLLAAIPTGVFDVVGVVCAAGGASFEVFFSAAFIGKMLKPYAAAAALSAIRSISSIQALSCLTSPVISFLSGNSSMSALTGAISTEQVLCVAMLVCAIVSLFALMFPSVEDALVDDEGNIEE